MICMFYAFRTLVVLSHSEFIISVSPLLDFTLPKCRNYIAISQPFKALSSCHVRMILIVTIKQKVLRKFTYSSTRT